MNVTPVLAVLKSRLGTDVAMIRLRRAGIDCKKISVVFPQRYTPNAIACWLKISPSPKLESGGEPLLTAGPWRAEVAKAGSGASVGDLIERAGIDPAIAALIERQLQLGHTLACVHAESETETAIAWHLFKHSMAEMIVVGGASAAAEDQPVPAEPRPILAWSVAA
jgi:hypothetical protein